MLNFILGLKIDHNVGVTGFRNSLHMLKMKLSNFRFIVGFWGFDKIIYLKCLQGNKLRSGHLCCKVHFCIGKPFPFIVCCSLL